MKERISSAHVLAIIAIVLALGGNAFAFQLGKNSVGSKQLKKNAVTTAKVKKEAITAAKVKKGTLTGTQIDVSTLGTVPSAVNAQFLGGLSVNQVEESSKRHCPAGTEPAAGVCFETTNRQAALFEKALEVCGKANRSLPTVGEFAAYLLTRQSQIEGWAGSQFLYEDKFFAPGLRGDSEGITPIIASLELTLPFRCVTQATN